MAMAIDCAAGAEPSLGSGITCAERMMMSGGAASNGSKKRRPNWGDECSLELARRLQHLSLCRSERFNRPWRAPPASTVYCLRNAGASGPKAVHVAVCGLNLKSVHCSALHLNLSDAHLNHLVMGGGKVDPTCNTQSAIVFIVAVVAGTICIAAAKALFSCTGGSRRDRAVPSSGL